VFPAEFATFLFPDDVRKAIFSQDHEELFAVERGPISRSRSSLSS
jgi:isocitrate dehydrogenase kinase/phosphatase